jgi:hypothetical protein
MISMKIWRTVIAIDDHLKTWPWLVIWTNLRYKIRDIYHAQPIARRYSSLLCVELLCCVVHQLAILQCQLLALFTLYILCPALVSMGNLKLTQLWLHVQRGLITLNFHKLRVSFDIQLSIQSVACLCLFTCNNQSVHGDDPSIFSFIKPLGASQNMTFGGRKCTARRFV